MDKKVTIILANYNKENYLRTSLGSIVGLSRFDEMNVIIVDDGSKDNSINIINEFVNKYDNFKLIAFDKGSGGPSKPRNTALDLVKTDYVIFMDPDDKIINDGYSLLLTKMEEYQSDILIATRVGVDEEGNQRFTDYIEPYPYINTNDQVIKLDLLNQRPFILKTIYSTKLINDNGIRFNEKISTSEDEIFDMECVGRASKITKINDIVYQYTFESADSITTKVSLKIYEELYDVMLGIEKGLKPIFDQRIISMRIVALLDVFYFRKITFLKTEEEISKACDLIYQACEKYGFDRLDMVVSRHLINVMEMVKNKEYIKAFARFYRNRYQAEIDLNRQYIDEMKTLSTDINDLDKFLNRKAVKPIRQAFKYKLPHEGS